MRARYGASLTRREKSAGDFATAADIEAEQAILDVLRRARPEDAVVGEESGRTGATIAERMWLVDPLCGTRNYVVRSMRLVVNLVRALPPDETAAADRRSATPSTCLTREGRPDACRRWRDCVAEIGASGGPATVNRDGTVRRAAGA